MEYVLPCFLSLIISIIVLFLVGQIFIYWIGKDFSLPQHQLFFESVFIGTLLAVLTYAICTTSFFTIMVGIFFFSYFFFRNKRRNSPKQKRCIHFSKGLIFAICFIVAPSIMYFSWQLITIYDFKSHTFLACNADLHSAAFWVNDINKSGIERIAFPTIPENFISSKSAYHYFEYWFTALIAKVSHLPPILIFKLITVPTFCVIIHLGIVAFIKSISKLNVFYTFIIPFGLIFFSQPLLPISLTGLFSQIDYNITLNIGVTEAMLYKTLPLYAILVFIVNLITQKKYDEALGSFIIIPLINIATFPSIIIGYLTFLLLMTFYRHQKNIIKIDIKAHILLLGSSVMFIYLFYFFGNHTDDFTGIKKNFSLQNAINIYRDTSNIKRAIYFASNKIFGLIEVILTIIALVYLGLRTAGNKISLDHRISIISILITILSSFFLYVFFSYSNDNFGFYRVIILPFINVSAFFILVYFSITSKTGLKYIFISLLIINVGVNISRASSEILFWRNTEKQKIDLNYYNTVSKLLNKVQSKNGLIFHSERHISSYDFGKNQEYDLTGTHTSTIQRVQHDIYYPSMFLNAVFPDLRTFSVSKPVILEGYEDDTLKYASFYDYFCQKNSLNFHDVQNKLKFKKSINASFAIKTKWAKVPREFLAIISDSCTNDKTGDRFYLFKY
jgi:hypothetical protein